MNIGACIGEIMKAFGSNFFYREDRPLIFTDPIFWVFFGIVLVGFAFTYKKRGIRNAFLFIVSVYFYYKTSGFFFSLLLFSTVADYFIGFRIEKTAPGNKKKSWLALSIIINLGVLLYFKYAYFFADSFNATFGTEWHPINNFAAMSNELFGSTFRVDKILLPVGISFYTFQTMSYAIDLYRGHIKSVKSIFDFGFYVSFFPQLVAGPIVRAADFIPQLYKEYSLTKQQFGIALFWILNGLLKKFLLADYLALNFVDRVFANPASYSGFENLMGLYAYSMQVYADFSGYTDIAIGVALLVGFSLPKNFNSPYKAVSVGDFWKRWHISLSSWLKDYLYIPMGGNRGGSLFTFISLAFVAAFLFLLSGSFWIMVWFAVGLAAALLLGLVFPKLRGWYITNINVMITMLLGGLWHGASWNFMLWGGLNGLGLVVYKLWKRISPWEDKSKWYSRAWGIFLTFNFISFTRIWFRSSSATSWESINEGHNILEEWFSANTMLLKMTEIDFTMAPDVIMGFWKVFTVLLIGFIIHWLPATWKESYRQKFARAPLLFQLTAAIVVILILVQVVSADLQPFIYFQF
ncbi:MAG: D-alanyl-lipoteichoic acid acyltransferase DltB (MBOAT superfamily) [Flavobacteriales bacterium]|jgi:alginate O-acetyltransferase complex protein AlgI